MKTGDARARGRGTSLRFKGTRRYEPPPIGSLIRINSERGQSAANARNEIRNRALGTSSVERRSSCGAMDTRSKGRQDGGKDWIEK